MRSDTDNFDYGVYRELFALRWRLPTPEAVTELNAKFAARHAQLGQRLFFLTLVGPDTPQPDEPTREMMLHGMPGAYERLRMSRVVFLGSGLRVTLLRSVVTAMTLVSGLRGQPFFVDKSLDAATQVIAKQLGHDPAQVIEMLLAQGLLSPEEAKL